MRKMKNIYMLVAMVAVIITLSGCIDQPPEIKPTPGATQTPIDTIKPTVTEITKEGGIKFVDIATGELIVTDISKNTIFVAENATQIDMFGKWDSDLSNKVKSINLENMLVVAVFLSDTNTGSTIMIKDISQTEGKIRITANLAAPEAGGTRISYPYDVIAVPKDQIRMPIGTIWQVYSEDGNLLAETTYP